MRAVGFKIYGSGRSARSDRPNRSAALAIRSEIYGGDASGVLLLPGVERRGRRLANGGGTHRRCDRPMGFGRARAKWGEGDMANLLVRSASSEEQRKLASD